MWRCSVCGYIDVNEGAPESCPKCGALTDKFVQVPQEKADLINRSQFSNQLHMDLVGMLENVIELSEDGIEDALDPNCVAIFTKAKDQAVVLQQMIKAEIEGHISKGKWG